MPIVISNFLNFLQFI